MAAERLLLFDLDGTLLRSDKSISSFTMEALARCRQRGLLLGVATARSEQNARRFLADLRPDAVISSGGALAKWREKEIYRAAFSSFETQRLLDAAQSVCPGGCGITVDTLHTHFWNDKEALKQVGPSWGESVYTDYLDFRESALKICVELSERAQAERIAASVAGCVWVKFSDGDWYSFSKEAATKERALVALSAQAGIPFDQMIAFGDDYGDISMLQLCGKGVAMGNAIPEVKAAADMGIGSNDEDGIAHFLIGRYFR